MVTSYSHSSLLIHPGIGTAQQSAEVLTVKALEECDFGRRSKEREVRLAHFKRSQSLAEQALALNDRLADGHFALFCSLGNNSASMARQAFPRSSDFGA